MISLGSFSAFSSQPLSRTTASAIASGVGGTSASQGSSAVQQVRAQSSVTSSAAKTDQSAGSAAAMTSGSQASPMKLMPRGSLLDLSV